MEFLNFKIEFNGNTTLIRCLATGDSIHVLHDEIPSLIDDLQKVYIKNCERQEAIRLMTYSSIKGGHDAK